jgi:uncharacterized repeat protein (TIGR03837 family)
MPDLAHTRPASLPHLAYADAGTPKPARQWDVFCRVIDNHGDLGVCWRLACHLAGLGSAVRLWVDHATDLQWMAPKGYPGVQVLPWPIDNAWPVQPHPLTTPLAQPPNVPTALTVSASEGSSPPMLHGVIEAFGCELPDTVQAALAAERPAPVWINLEYLSAEAHVERLHGMPSPVMSGPARGLQKWFFYPGFTAQTGGLLHPLPPKTFATQQTDPKALDAASAPALTSNFSNGQADGISASGHPTPAGSAQGHAPQAALRVLLFCYEPASLPTWLTAWADGPQPIDLSVCAGRASRAVQAWQAQRGGQGDGALRITHLPWVSQAEFDALLAGHDLNLVRGEDSLVRALWAGQALLWQIYPQDDGVHHTKLADFLSALGAPPTLAQAHRAWNADSAQSPPALSRADLQSWGHWVRGVRQGLLAQPDLAQQLTAFAAAKRGAPNPQG